MNFLAFLMWLLFTFGHLLLNVKAFRRNHWNDATWCIFIHSILYVNLCWALVHDFFFRAHGIASQGTCCEALVYNCSEGLFKQCLLYHYLCVVENILFWVQKWNALICGGPGYIDRFVASSWNKVESPWIHQCSWYLHHSDQEGYT